MLLRKIQVHLSRKYSQNFMVQVALEHILIHVYRLQQLQRTQWKDKVNILFGDMRHLNVPEQADILVSELLGSFGDNELSPECLDGAMRFLKGDARSILMQSSKSHAFLRGRHFDPVIILSVLGTHSIYQTPSISRWPQGREGRR